MQNEIEDGRSVPDGLSQAEPKVSALRASIPSAWQCLHCHCQAFAKVAYDERLVRCINCKSLHSAPRVSAQMEKGFRAAVSAIQAWAHSFYLAETRDQLLAIATDLSRNEQLILESASGIEAGTDETLQAAQPEGPEPGPQGDAKRTSHAE